MRINEITEEADVGFGSFYNHFDSKDEIVAQVLGETARDHLQALVRITTGLTDPAETCSVALRRTVARARADPAWGWLFVRLDASHRIVLTALGRSGARLLEAGVDAGRFKVANVTIALHAGTGALVAVMQTVLEGGAGDDADVQLAEQVLRMLGLRAGDAAKVAARPMPEPPPPAAGES